MLNFDLIGFVGTAYISSYLTFCAIDEVDLKNEGKSKFTLVSYLLIIGGSLIKLVFSKGAGNEVVAPEEPPSEYLPENVLVV